VSSSTFSGLSGRRGAAATAGAELASGGEAALALAAGAALLAATLDEGLFCLWLQPLEKKPATNKLVKIYRLRIGATYRKSAARANSPRLLAPTVQMDRADKARGAS